MDSLNSQQIMSLMNLLQGGGGGGDQPLGSPPSGLPYTPALSGLWTLGSMSGASEPSMSGSSGRGSLVPGIQGGPSLAELQPTGAEGADTSGAANLSSLFSGIGGGSIGQQQTGQYGQAGGTSPGGGQGGYATSGQGGGGSVDPAALIAKLLGAVKSGVGLASPLIGQSSLGTQADLQGSNADAYRAQREGERQDFTSSPLQAAYASNYGPEFAAFAGNTSPTDYFNKLVTAGLTPAQANDVMMLQTEAPELSAAFTGGPGGAVGSGAIGQTGGSLSGTGSGGGGSLAGQTNIPGAIQGGLSGSLGLLNLIQGLRSGNIGQDIGGGLQGIGGIAQLLQSSPDLAKMLGLGDLGGGAYSTLGAGIGGLGGLLSLAQGIQSGNPLQIGSGALGALSAGSTLYGQLAGTGASGLSGLLASVAPETAAAIASALGVNVAANAGTQAISAALGTALSGAGAVAAPIIMAITSYLSEADARRAREAGYTNNPIAGALYSQATQGVGADLGLLDQIQQAGGLGNLTVQQEEALLPRLLNNLIPYYQTAQGGARPIRASSSVTGGDLFNNTGQGPDAIAQYTGNFTRAQQGMYDVLNDLMSRGVSYQELGQLPVSNAWSNLTLDAYNPLRDLYAANKAQYDTAAQPMLQGITQASRQMLDPQEAMRMAAEGLNPATFGYTQDASGNWYSSPRIATGNPNGDFYSLQPGQLTPDLLFNAAQGAGYFGAPDKDTKAGGLTSAMYGGPLWEAIARMSSPTWGANVQPGSLQAMIQQNFNPWAVVGGFNPGQLQSSLQPILQSMAGGGGLGGGLPGNSEGSSSSPTGDGVSSGVW